MSNIEHKIVNFIAGFSPWFAPAIPTYFTIHNALTYLLYGTPGDKYFVWILAIALEFVGLAAVHTVLEFWTWNKKHQSGEQAPVAVAIVAAVIYIAVVLTVNVVLELYPNSMYAAIFARGTLSLLSIPAALIVGIRAIHNRRMLSEKDADNFQKQEQAKDNEANREIKKMKAAAKYGTSGSAPVSSGSPAISGNTYGNPLPVLEMGFKTTPISKTGSVTGRPPVHQERVFQYMDKVFTEQKRIASFSEVERDLNLSQSTASRLRSDWIKKAGKND